MAGLTAGEITSLVGGELRGDQLRTVTAVAALEKANSDAVSFIASARYLQYLQATRAGIVLVTNEWVTEVPAGCTAVVVDDPHQALYTVLTELYPPTKPPKGIHPTASVAASAQISPDVSVGPYAVVGDEVMLGPGTVIGSHSVIREHSRLGSDVIVHPHVTIYPGVSVGDRVVIHSGARVGKDGFGYVWRDGGHRKIPQIGGCILEDDVEIGTNVTIDRGSIGDTVIGVGTKIDNLVHLGHNVRIGRHAVLVSQVGISGSSSIGDGAMLGGQVGVAGHLSIGANARIGGQAGVISNVPAGETYSGYPARPHREALRAQAGFFKLPELMRRLKQLEEAVFGSARRSP